MQLPSFFKIRMVVLVAGFFLLFFCIGFVRWCFALDSCLILFDMNTESLSYTPASNYSLNDFTISSSGVPVLTDFCDDPSIQNQCPAVFYAYGFSTPLARYAFFNGLNWEYNSFKTGSFQGYQQVTPSFRDKWYSDHGACTIISKNVPFDGDTYIDGTTCSDFGLTDCILPCDQKLALWTQACPYGLKSYDCELDTFECNDAPSNCNDLKNLCYDSCTDGVNLFTCDENDLSSAVCKCNLPDTCPELMNQCADQCGIVQEFACNYDPLLGSTVTTPCTCKNDDCESSRQSCLDQCGGQIKTFACSDGVVSTPCVCLSTNPLDPPLPNDPPDTDSELLRKTANNTSITASNTATTNTLLQQTNNKIDQSNTSLKSIDLNTRNINNKIDTTNDLLINQNNKTDTTNDKLDIISDKLEGTYTKETISNDYMLPSDISDVSEYTTRFTSFIDDIKATPLFSLPNQVLFNIPNSSVSNYTIDMGQYGTFDFDLANYSTILIILRSAFLTCFGYAALRIVVSKR